MKTKWCWVLLLVFAVATIPAFAEQGRPLITAVPTVGFSFKNDHSATLPEMAKKLKAGTQQQPREIPIQRLDVSKRAHAPALNYDPLLGPFIPRGPMPSPILTWDAGSDDQNQSVVGFRINPPDNDGDVGGSQYVQWINLIITVFDKTTGATLFGPAPGNVFFVGFGGVCEGTNRGDPTVNYDQFTGRWVISQFDWNTGTQCVAVSQTGDATGSYYRYAFNVNNGNFNDYPKMGNWSDAYYHTFRDFGPGGSAYQGPVAVAFEKAKMIQGLPAQFVRFAVPMPAGVNCAGAGDCYDTLQPANAVGLAAPPAGAPNPISMAFDDEWWSPPGDPTQDFYKIWYFHVDWTTPANSTLSAPVNVSSPEFDQNLCNGSRSCIAQPAGGEGLDALTGFTMWRSNYRNYGGTQSLYVATSVNVSGTPGGSHSGVRWAQINSPNASPTLYQAGTHAPDGDSRWMASMNADQNGNIAIGYSVSSGSTYPSIRYAGRLSGDPLGTLPQTETELFAGTGSQTASANRWGDYSAMSVDPADDCTFYYTQGYYATTSSFNFHTRIGSFKFPSCTSGPTGTLAGTVTTTGSGIPIANANIQIGPSYSTSTDAAGHYSILIPIGTYDVTASHFGYASQTATGVVVATNATTTQDFQLTPNAQITVDGFVTDGSGGSMPLYALVNVSSTGGSVNLYTNPLNGYYSFSAYVGTQYTLTATAQIPGYNVGTASITTGTVDMQQNFPLTVNQASCNAPGYQIVSIGTPITADFNSGSFPPGWTSVNTTINCSAFYPGYLHPDWAVVSGMPEAGNMTGGSGMFAAANSDACGTTVQMDTTMTSPDIDLTTFTGNVRINFNSDYNDLCSSAAGSTVTLDIWTGSAWSTIFNYCGQSNRRGPRLESFVTTAGDGAMSKVRWRYKARWDWWWEVDNVNISQSACVFTNGGMLYGNVFDLNTGLALNGASVALDTGQTTTTGPTPNDPNIPDGFYYMYAPTQTSAQGVRVMTVSKSNYGTITRNVVPTPRGSHQENFNLPAGRLAAAPPELRERVAIGGSGTKDLTLTNSGTLVVNWALLELNVPPPAARPAGPFQVPIYPFDEHTKVGYLASTARNAQNVPHGAPPNVPIYPRVGEYVREFSAADLNLPWGGGYDFTATKFWISNPGIFFGATNYDSQRNDDGTPTGVQLQTNPAGGSWAGDMAYVGLTNKMWQVNVGGNDCIFEFDPVADTITGNHICPAFGTSMRGLAYDPATTHFYAGTWNGNFIMEFAADGSTVRTVNVGLPVSGLAYNATTHHLFAQVNASLQKVYILDAAQASLPVLGSFILQDSAGNNAFGAFSGAGLELDCAGNLWAVNQSTKKVFINSVGETGACAVDIPWLTEDPTSGSIDPGASATSTFTFTSAGMAPGCKEAQVLVTNDTPYGILDETVGITVQFNDVPLGTFGDFFIHGIAGAGISFGCGAGNFCPNDDMTRRLMPVWLLRGKFGRFYQPPPAQGIFADVSPESFAADWIEDFYNRGFTSGCGTNPLRYCPDQPVTREQMAVFLLVTKEGSAYRPPPCTGVFTDVPCTSGYAPWIEEIFHRGITSGCSTNPPMYCPAATASRAQMSVFVSVDFGIPKCKQ